MQRARAAATILTLLLAASPCAAAPPPASAFARIPAMSAVTLSADGARIAYLSGIGGVRVVLVYELAGGGGPRIVLASRRGQFDVEWCRFKNAMRLVCGLVGVDADGGTLFNVTRLVAVDADGKNMKVLVQGSRAGAAQYQDQVLDWLPASPDRVLVQAQDAGEAYPSVFELDVGSGKLYLRDRAHAPIRRFLTDSSGEVRVGCGYQDTRVACFARAAGDSGWRQLHKYEAFQDDAGVLDPVAFGRERDLVYALGTFEGREALWSLDLADAGNPRVEFSHPRVDVDGPVRAADGHLLGVLYETDRPQVYAVDAEFAAQLAGFGKAVPDSVVSISSRSADGRRMIVVAESDTNAGSYYLFDRDTSALTLLGHAYPELAAPALGRMRAIEYPARDGVLVPGYLTVPSGYRAEHLPLIVMPHGGPIRRDSWGFDFLQQFLVSRGYAVLQMNFRGSSGYGGEWLHAAHQDWGGLTYADITDATRWAIAQGIADPARICIVGWSFGGYAALLSAVRDGALYRCAASIAGVSDLSELEWAERDFSNYQIVRRQIGTDRKKLADDSPLRHARDAAVPVLLVHGVRDANVPVAQSKRMAAALQSAGKRYELLLLDGQDHDIRDEAERARLLEALERFLAGHLGAGLAPRQPDGG